MIFYRRLAPFTAISFDLDDTLYSNRPILIAAEQAMVAFFSKKFSPDIAVNRSFWLEHRQQALQQNPALQHDVSQLRFSTYYLAATSLGLSSIEAEKIAQQALTLFLSHRSEFTVSPQTLALLSQLRQQFPLIAITNGNVDANKIGISPYFKHIIHPALGHLSKPEPDMFIHGCHLLNIRPQQLLHIGDCGRADIIGALTAGCQTAWLNQYNVGKAISVLPHVELSSLAQLIELM